MPYRSHLMSTMAMLLTFNYAAFAEIVPDGTTNTNVAIDTAGHATIDIAPRNSDGISLNRYDSFNVNSAGADFNNRDVAARTIVNEVTGVGASSINGDIAVLGPRAHVIVANPNGISVDGARFINVGGLALATGEVELIDQPIAPGITQTNAVVSTSGGQITVGEGGLSGVMTQLHLLAESIVVDGVVANETVSPAAGINMLVGGSRAEFDSSLPASDLSREWAALDSMPQPGAPAIVVDISETGGLSSGRVEIAVTDEGAGVRHAGNILASQNQFQLTADGDVEIVGGRITAATNVNIQAANLTQIERLENDLLVGAQIEATNGALLITTGGNIHNRGGRLQALVRDPSLTGSLGAITLTAGGEITNESVDAELLGIVFAQADDLVLDAQGDITNNTGRFIANQDVIINTPGQFANVITEPEFAGRGVVTQRQEEGRRLWYSLWIKRRQRTTFAVDYGEAQISDQLAFTVANGDVTINADQVINAGGEIDANDGDINIDARRVETRAILTGSATFEQLCSVFGCDRTGDSTVRLNGGSLNSSGSIIINAEEQLLNIGGQLLAFDSIDIVAPDVSAQSLETFSVVQRPQGLRGWFSFNEAMLLRMDQGGSFIANMGQIDFDSLSAVRVDGGVVSAGTINATNGIEQVSEPQQDNPAFGEHIGLLRNWFE